MFYCWCRNGGGAGIVLFKKFKCKVYGIEPNKVALDIIHSKCKEIGLNPNNFKRILRKDFFS